MKRLPFLIALVSAIVPASVFAHGGHKHTMGTVASVTANSLTIHTSSGDVAVPLSGSTKYFHGSGTSKPATFAELSAEMRVVVHSDASGSATEVHMSSPPAAVEDKTDSSGVLTGKITGRDAKTNRLTVQHDEVKGLMAAMTMAYEVKGAKVTSLPPDGTSITAMFHAKAGSYWLTDVKESR
jgi:Cu/Ag efflux protein CusF